MAEQRSVVAPYFSNLEQQREANSLGMWVFLATEVMFFGGLFMAYAAYHLAYPIKDDLLPDLLATGHRLLLFLQERFGRASVDLLASKRIETCCVVGFTSKDEGEPVGLADLLAERVQHERRLSARKALDAGDELRSQRAISIAEPARGEAPQLRERNRRER